MRYTVVLEPDETGEGYTVRVPVLPGCITEGQTREEALANAREAIIGFIEALEKAGEPVPEEKEPVELGVEGAIVGLALSDGRLDLQEALAAVRDAR